MFSQAPVLLFIQSSTQWDDWIWVFLCYTPPRDKHGPIWHFLASFLSLQKGIWSSEKTKADKLELLHRPCLGRGRHTPWECCSLGVFAAPALGLCEENRPAKPRDTDRRCKTIRDKPPQTPVKHSRTSAHHHAMVFYWSLQGYWKKISIFVVFANSGSK